MKKILRILSNKYFLLTAFMVVWLTFFDKYNIIKRIEDEWQLHKMNEEAAYYRKETELVKQRKQELFSSSQSLEKFAREQYKMKKDDEDIFVFQEETK